MNTRMPIVLVAEDAVADRLLLQEAFLRAGNPTDLRLVNDGQELLAYLHRLEPWTTARLPDLILLDLKMPGMDGFDALMHIKSDAELKRIPVIVLTASKDELDVAKAYAYGANTYVPKPDSLDELAGVIEVLCRFWFRTCALPDTSTV
ncbi:MAG: response regulator [Bryobacterales bacterium]